MTKITAQAIFNAAWQEFIINKAPPAMRETTEEDGSEYKFSCCYLTPDGRKCAVGLCIPDGHALQKSTHNLNYLADRHPELFELNSLERHNLQDDLHDSLVDTNTGEWKYTPEIMKDKYLHVARKFKLTIPGA
jgi:hypothetical protein